MKRRQSLAGFVVAQVLVVGAFGASFARMTPTNVETFKETVTGSVQYHAPQLERNEPLVITPLYDDPEVVSDEDLAAILKIVQPRFQPLKMKPNYIEHALRTWHVDAKFQDPAVLDGEDMRDFLLDHGRFVESWGDKEESLLESRPVGVYVRWGKEFANSASVHHDHLLACLTEARVPANQPVRAPNRPNLTMKDVIAQAIYDFDLDERETEWSAMAFGLWLAPQKEWQNGNHRTLNFDMIAERQMRGHKQLGVCGGTHRVYSLVLLLRLDAEHHILSPKKREQVVTWVKSVRDLLLVTQFEDGHWPYNWPDGAVAVSKPTDHPRFRDVIATGHHLEWLSIAPEEFQIPRENVRKAAKWIINKTKTTEYKDILGNYTFFSHVGNSLAQWRKTRPADAWHKWEAAHPYQPEDDKKADAQKPAAHDHKHADADKADAPKPEVKEPDATKTETPAVEKPGAPKVEIKLPEPEKK